jgi:hypothetical protein
MLYISVIKKIISLCTTITHLRASQHDDDHSGLGSHEETNQVLIFHLGGLRLGVFLNEKHYFSETF